jgi:hypothetical protein
MICQIRQAGEMPDKEEAVVRVQVRPFAKHRFGLSFVTNIQDNEAIDLPQI